MLEMRSMTVTDACNRFVDWLDRRLVAAGRGDTRDTLEVDPSGQFWLGRLASEETAAERNLGARGERLDPCAIGLSVIPASVKPWRFEVRVSLRAWIKRGDVWSKSPAVTATIPIVVTQDEQEHGADVLATSLDRATGQAGLTCVIRTECEVGAQGLEELTIRLVNTSPAKHKSFKDTNLYECKLELQGLATSPFMLEALPDSFRYDRRVCAYGINCGVEADGVTLRTSDVIRVDRGRPVYWNGVGEQPDLRFKTLASSPLSSLARLVEEFEAWGTKAWSDEALGERRKTEQWTDEMWSEVERARSEFLGELERVKTGLELLRNNVELRRSFQLMNEAIGRAAGGKYDGWRAFQIGFILANLSFLVQPERESDVADVVWFATGGGKTETYLGIVVTAAFLDRLRGKKAGLTAWSRFPLRMLSLQQTQRFADAMAAAELVRRRASIDGSPFSVGFFVGSSGTPNAIKPNAGDEGGPNPDDPDMPKKYRVLLRCPFCSADSIEMAFNRRIWTLEHRCTAEGCEWPEEALPFYVVDEEIYRFLPTIVVGTLDKAASISMQASMRGLVGPPWGTCSRPGHGYTYAPRSKRPRGCLVPDCNADVLPAGMEERHFGPTMRLQDELHLLKDSLGAVDSHYEALLDHLQSVLTGTRAKILGSSATLSGYEKQVDVLYQRKGRVFPALGPSASDGFWSRESEETARRFVALAPRGVTVEFAIDRSLTVLQECVRELHRTPAAVCKQAGIPEEYAGQLLDLYGVDVVYGNTIRDIDAAARSFETQVKVEGPVNTASLTGKTDFDEVRTVLQRLDKPEDDFHQRIHLVAASAMMSHGVDIDRLNVMLMMGTPLTTAEFIQATARVGRRYPGLVLVFPKIARERDASVYRSFEHFVRQGDRFVEPVPITGRSRRVLEKTIAGLALARVLHIHEPNAGRSLATVQSLRAFLSEGGMVASQEFELLKETLGLNRALDAGLERDLQEWLDTFFDALRSPPPNAVFPSDLSPTGSPMLSLRDVEEQAPIVGVSE